MDMPTYERRLFLQFLRDDMIEEKRKIEEVHENNVNGKTGHRTRRISGDKVKDYVKNNQHLNT